MLITGRKYNLWIKNHPDSGVITYNTLYVSYLLIICVYVYLFGVWFLFIFLGIKQTHKWAKETESIHLMYVKI